ncbi:MAG: putative metal-binding motif-containing protein, partial [Chloroflexota bacterium]
MMQRKRFYCFIGLGFLLFLFSTHPPTAVLAQCGGPQLPTCVPNNKPRRSTKTPEVINSPIQITSTSTPENTAVPTLTAAPPVESPTTCTEISWYPDLDKDGYGDGSAQPIKACEQPAGYSSTNNDCNDQSNAQHPGAADVCGDGIDQTCSGADTA